MLASRYVFLMGFERCHGEVVGMETTPLDAFRRNPDGSWTSLKPTAIKTETKLIQIPQGMTFRKGEEYLFVDVAQWLEEHSS